MVKVIVFGPTGGVGSYVARTAQEHGATVTLAMRDTSKVIPTLTTEQEKEGGFQRVTADLTKPETCAEAVKQSGATRAFIYLAHHAQDHMQRTLEALKAAGIEFVVFLSSYTVTRDPSEIPQHEIIPWLHAQVEIQLESIFGAKNYVAIRPGAFATNTAGWWGAGIKAGEVKLFGPKVPFDFTPQEDMGGVAGVILAKGTKDGEKIVYVFGPQFIPTAEALDIIQKEASTKPFKVTILESEQEAADSFAATGFPVPLAKYLAHVLALKAAGTYEDDFTHLEEGQQNVQKYLNRSGIQLSDWVKKHKEIYA